MAKKSKTSRSRKTHASKTTVISPRTLILILVFLGLLFVADRLNLIDVDWEALLGEAGPSSQDRGQPAARRAPAVEAVTGEWYRLYFTSPHYPDDPANRADVIVQGLIEALNGARQSLDVAVYELNLGPVGDALLAARDRGVRVRLVTDSDSLAEDETLMRLQESGLAIVADERSPIMHNKFVVVDGQAVWTGSWNFTTNDTFRNNNHALYIQSSQLAQNYAAEFEEMFGRKEFGPTSSANTPAPQVRLGDTLIETCFAPEDECAARIIQTLNQAQKSIRFMAFSFTHSGIGQAVRDRARAGVSVQGVFETRGSETEASQYGLMRRAKLDVWQDGNPYTLHHKVFVVDDQVVVLGSFNFSSNADEANDENMLIIHNAGIAGQFLAEFERVYSQAINPSK
jgi:phosphatidylserine/phosphatidylglycerophosphate/cardiolipin synthase-like enzyme